MSRVTKPWSDVELDILRRPITAEQMRELMPDRSNQAIRLKRNKLVATEGFTPVNPAPDYKALARKSVERRRVAEAERKSQFIMAINAGTSFTYNGIVTRSAYQRWREKDPEFLAWFEGFKHQKRAVRQAIRDKVMRQRQVERSQRDHRRKATRERQAKARATPMGESHRRRLMENDVYRIASQAIGRFGTTETRDAAISAMVLDLLEGIVNPDEATRRASKYRSAARGEISFTRAEDKHDLMASYAAWMDTSDDA